MKTATSGFISAISDGCPYHTVKFYYNGTELDIEIKDFNHYGLMIGGENISIGETCASHIEFELYNPTITLENKEIQVKLGIEVNGSIEYIPLGYFTVTKPSIESEVYKYTAYDRMIGLERLYASSLTNPTTTTVMYEIATQLGYTFVSAIPDIPLDVNKIKGYTYREMLGFISALCGANCIFNGNGEIEFKWFVQPTSDLATIGTDRLYENGLELNSDEDLTIGYIKCATGAKEEVPTETVDVILTVGSGNFGINISNPLMTQEVLENIYNTYFNNFTFRPCKVNLLGNILLECGDIVTVNNGTNTYNVPIMSIQHSIDGGVVTNIESVAQNETEQEINYTSPTVKLMDRVYSEIIEANKALVNELIANSVTTEYLKANYAQINLANIEKACITTAMIGTEAVKTSQIADGSITDAKIVELTANKIKAGTLDVERLIVTQNNQKYLFHVNEDGTTEYQKLNGNILEDRSVTADKIVANAITANEIASRTITANKIVSGSITANEIAANTITSAEIKSGTITASKIDVNDLFAQDITATGTITGMTLKGGNISLSRGLYFCLDDDINNYIGGILYEVVSSSNDSASGYVNKISIESDGYLSVGCGSKTQIFGEPIELRGGSLRIYSNSIAFNSVCSLDSALYLGTDTDSTINSTRFYINNNGTGRFKTLFENGTALSDKYASSSHASHDSILSNGSIGYSGTTISFYKKWSDSSNHDMITATNSYTAVGYSSATTYLRGSSYKLGSTSGTTITSDINLKKDFTELYDKYDKFYDELKPKLYKYIHGTSDRYHCGFITQEVENALSNSELTTQEFGGVNIMDIDRQIELDENGNEVDIKNSGNNYLLDKGITKEHDLIYSEFIALNTWQIQKLKTKVKEQQNEIEILKQRLENVEQKVGGNSAS